ncbi:class I SAM-dependent methyltransferase [Hymenobacter sp. GOD-10R]|uniref:class I SAM-dependent methyltransferase n=1 Tax=Hymenobacter sp. GOD-10R TaxID=3093922 RepID=UPI002D78F308|nr:methyltransferase domain-containing protein [Hymenobacter sp. GOD-10R]WRQ30440.1 methyltransferase domain-containing protein [Hymenobacter sp. GOD-10R]
MDTIQEQFDAVSQKYDSQRHYLIPCYQDFYTACFPLIKLLPQAKTVLDIGAGTGLFSYFLYQLRPELHFTLVDLSPEMLNVAKQRFAELPNFAYQQLDFSAASLPGQYDIIISSLAIHHLEDEAKSQLYQNVYAALNPGGLFINADQVAGRTIGFDTFYKQNWKETVTTSGLDEDAIQRAFERIKLDKFATLEAQLQMLERAGFTDVDCIYKNLNFVVFGGTKGALTL